MHESERHRLILSVLNERTMATVRELVNRGVACAPRRSTARAIASWIRCAISFSRVVMRIGRVPGPASRQPASGTRAAARSHFSSVA